MPDDCADVLMITYNRPVYTRKSLGRLLETADERTRVWLWHNGDDEPTLDVVRGLAEHPRVHKFHHSHENVRLREPTNWLYANAQGVYLSKVDDDCLVPYGWLGALRTAHEDESRFGIIGCWRFQEEDFLPQEAGRKIRTFAGGHRLLVNWWIEGSGYLMKRACVEAAGLIGPKESFTEYCRRVACAGWINGWAHPFLYQDHMDDPRSPNTLLRSDADIEKHLPLSAQRNGVETVAQWQAQLQRSARVVQTAPTEPPRPNSPRQLVRRARGWVRRRMGNRRMW